MTPQDPHIAHVDAQQEAQQEKRISGVVHEMEQHGENMAIWANRLAVVLLAVFSTASLLSLSLKAFNTFMAQLAAGRLDIPDALSVLLNLLLVLAMDMAMFYAATVIRAILSAGGERREIILHVVVMATASILETSTYIYLVIQYDRPTNPWLWAIGIGRGIAAPLFATYLSLARKLPVAPRDIAYYVALLSGQGVVRDVAMLAGDRAAPLQRKVSIYTAAATMAAAEYGKFQNIITAVTAPEATPTAKRQEERQEQPEQPPQPSEAPAAPPLTFPPARRAPAAPAPEQPDQEREEPAPAYAPAASSPAVSPDRRPTRTAARNQRRGLGRTGLPATTPRPGSLASDDEPPTQPSPDRTALRARREDAALRILDDVRSQGLDITNAELARRIAMATRHRVSESTARELRDKVLGQWAGKVLGQWADEQLAPRIAEPMPFRIITAAEDNDTADEEEMRQN